MLVELKEVEIYIEPETILTQALEDGDISTDTIVRECIGEDGVDAVLDAVDNNDIRLYCERLGLIKSHLKYEEIIIGVRALSTENKAKILWLLLKD